MTAVFRPTGGGILAATGLLIDLSGGCTPDNFAQDLQMFAADMIRRLIAALLL